MNSPFWTRVLCLSLLGASVLYGQSTTTIDNFESPTSPSPWSFYAGPGTTGSLTRGTGMTGYGAHLAYDMTNGGTYVLASLNFPAPVNASSLALNVKRPIGTNVWLRVTDSSGQTLQYATTTTDSVWYHLTVNLGPSTSQSHWGGTINDGQVHGSLVSMAVLLSLTTGNKIGALDFDDVQVSNSNTLIDNFESPTSPSPWSFYAGPGTTGSLTRGTGMTGYGAHLAYDMTNGGTYVLASLNFPAPVNASSLILNVKRPVGTNVWLRVTDSSGQTLQYATTTTDSVWYHLTVNLGPSTSQSHWGGTINDGQVHGPLVSMAVLLSLTTGNKIGALDFDDVQASNGPQTIDDFESASSPSPWYFFNGSEYPGATGSLTRGTGLSGYGAHLAYNMTNGGNYVSATLNFPAPISANAIALDVRHPSGSMISLRVTDSSGQTLQYSPSRNFESTNDGLWYHLSVYLGQTPDHWGGTINDGVPHGALKTMVVMIQPTTTTVGALDFDNVQASNGLTIQIDPSSAALNPVTQPNFGANLGVELESTEFTTAPLDLAKSLGFSWVRTELFWANVEIVKGSYNWSAYDSMLASLQSRGMKAHFILCYGNPIYTGKYWMEPPRTSSDIAGFAAFAQTAAAHFANKSVEFEIWNEQNTTNYWNPVSVSEYVALSKPTITQVHVGNPSAKVSTGGVAGIDLVYLQSMIQAGGATGANAIAIHPYNVNIPERLNDNLLAGRTLVANLIPTNTPAIWSTEQGFSSTWYGAGDAAANRTLQAKYGIRQLLTQAALNVSLDNVFALHDHGTDTTDPEQNFGIVGNDYSTKPFTTALLAFNRQLTGHTFSGVLSSGVSDLHALRFASSADTTVVLWSETIGGGVENVYVPKTPYAVVDYLGNPVTTTLVNGQTVIPVADTPVYVVFH